MRYDYYTPGHKYFRKHLSNFETVLATADFNNADERVNVLEMFDALTHMLKETARYEKENCHILIREMETFTVAQVEAGYSAAEEKESQFRELFGQVKKNRSLSHEEQTALYQAGVDFVDTYRLQLSYKENVLLPLLYKYNTDADLRALAMQSRSQMSFEQIKEIILDQLFTCVNFFEKIWILKDIKDSTSEKLFEQVFDSVSSEFKPYQLTIINKKLNADD
jgi:hypothetical protein